MQTGRYYLIIKQFFESVILSVKNYFVKGKAVQAIRKGLIFMTPLVILCSIALVGINFPISGYQEWLHGEGTRWYLSILTLIHSATASFLILINVSYADFNPSYLSTAGISSALLAALVTTRLFYHIGKLPLFKAKEEDKDSFLSKMTASIIPLGIVLILFSSVAYVIETTTGGCLQKQIEILLNLFFSKFKMKHLLSGAFYIVTLHLLWFFGIHGSHVYFEINEVYFKEFLHKNIQSVEVGMQPTEIVNTVFLNSVCDLGGAGSTLALVAAILLVSKNKSNRRIAKFGFIPSLFNVNEILLFGMPIVFNPVFFIPFISIPLINLCLAYAATAIGLIPVIAQDINWTTPPFLSGYIATGSFSGVILQIFLLVLDVAIYVPFVKKLDKISLPM